MSITPTRLAAWTVAVLASLALAGGALAARTPLVRTAASPRLHATILVDQAGRTLYHLSVERQGHFICASGSCLAFWHPLVVAKGVKPTGLVPLGTVRRPDGRLQVAYKGEPLYTFAADAKRGDVKGEGFEDVGVWHAATVGRRAAAAATATPIPTTPAGGYGYGR